jgi:serine/threonine protein kinase
MLARCFFPDLRLHSQILMYQLCKGVAFVHGRGVLHRDLKPHNLLMDHKTMALKIADLGLSHAFTVPLKKYTHEVWSGPLLTPPSSTAVPV